MSNRNTSINNLLEIFDALIVEGASKNLVIWKFY